MNTVAGQRAFEFAAVAEIDRDGRNWPLRAPVKHEAIAQDSRNLVVGIEHGAEEPAVGAAKFVSQFSEQAQREDRFAQCLRRFLCGVEICVPVKTGNVAVLLLRDSVKSCCDSLPLLIWGGCWVGDVCLDLVSILRPQGFQTGWPKCPQFFDRCGVA